MTSFRASKESSDRRGDKIRVEALADPRSLGSYTRADLAKIADAPEAF
jgi:hypothetical protein